MDILASTNEGSSVRKTRACARAIVIALLVFCALLAVYMLSYISSNSDTDSGYDDVPPPMRVEKIERKKEPASTHKVQAVPYPAPGTENKAPSSVANDPNYTSNSSPKGSDQPLPPGVQLY